MTKLSVDGEGITEKEYNRRVKIMEDILSFTGATVAEFSWAYRFFYPGTIDEFKKEVLSGRIKLGLTK